MLYNIVYSLLIFSFSIATLSLHALYDVSLTLEQNIQNLEVSKIPLRPKTKKSLTLFGYPINSPIGIAACAITTGKGIKIATQLGYDVVTYKTVRNHFAPLFSSQIYYVHVKNQLAQSDIGTTFQIQCKSDSFDTLAVTNSFGNNSFDPAFVIHDIAAARASLSDGQVLIVSIYGCGVDKEAQIKSFVDTAIMAYNAGAQIIEANLSCPNLGDNKFPYKDPILVDEICAAIHMALPTAPLIIKVGLFDNQEQMRSVLRSASSGGARGICGINSVPVYVTDDAGNFVYGRRSGLSGAPLLQLAEQFVKDARTIINEEQLDLILFATGGVTTADKFDVLFASGADIVLSACGAMFNERLASDYHHIHTYSGDTEKKELIKSLYQIGAIKLQNITVKSGSVSPIYFDMRTVISYPQILGNLATLINEKIKPVSFDILCGVPYGAVPLATAISLSGNHSMIMQRKEVKNYGTRKIIEGAFTKNAHCLLIEDVVTTGSSILDSIKTLEQEGLMIRDIIVVVDREQGGIERVRNLGYNVHVLCTLTEVLQVLLHEGIITHKQFASIKQLCIKNVIK